MVLNLHTFNHHHHATLKGEITMNNTAKPNFATWEHRTLSKLTHDLWDENVRLRDANEQLRLDLKDAMKLVRQANFDKDDWK